MTKAENILSWLRERDISTLALERNIKAPVGTIRLAIGNHRALPDKWIKPLETELKKYGFKA